MKDETWLVHGGRDPWRQQGMVNPPVYHASTVLFPSLAALEAAEADPFKGVYYGRFGTPVHFEFEAAVARLERAHGAVSTCSGLAAIAAALLTVARAGGQLLVADNVYGPTRKLCDGLLRQLGVETLYFDPLIDAGGLATLINAQTVGLFLEAPGSLTFELPDIPGLAAVAGTRDIPVLLDNTWATPLGFRALDHGVGISIHAATKYVVGHADAMLGFINCNEQWLGPVRKTTRGLGYCAGPDDVYLGLRGLRTLSVRLARHTQTAQVLCQWLSQQPEVLELRYPPRSGDAGHALWQRDFEGGSGLFGVIIRDCSRQALAAMLDGLALFGMGFSWGGYESLILPADPARSRTATSWRPQGRCLRIHAGLEDPQDLINDLHAGFERLRAAKEVGRVDN